MTYEEVLTQARKNMQPHCFACPVCDGRKCRNAMPGPGAKGTASSAYRNYDAWQNVLLNMDTLYEKRPVDTSLQIFGRTFRYPFFAAPVGAVDLHYGPLYNDITYNEVLIPAARQAGIAAFTGDGKDSAVMRAATDVIRLNGGAGVPTVKPWDKKTIQEKLEMIHASGAFAVAMDIDAAGLPFLQGCNPPAGAKSKEELAEIISLTDKPFIVKGIMTVRGAKKALEAGASAIIVSNHGGRVLDSCPGTCTVLKGICDAVGNEMDVLVDGGVRTGMDVFKALALGAKAVLIGRPFVTAIYGGGQEGVQLYVQKLAAELEDTMAMCGACSLEEITPEMVRI